MTGDYSAQQGYRGPAPLGIDADFGNTYSGGLGTGITIADVETGWTDDHEDIAHKAQGNYIGLCCAPYPWDHGTAVVGVLAGEHQELGVRGLVYDANILLSTHQGFAINVPAAITNAIAALTAGDFLVLEVQCQDAPLGPHPCEWDDAIFASVRLATASGIHVYAAGGNGGHDLDDPSYGGKFDRTVRDSGAVIVGASRGPALTAAIFSNYGSRVDLHGWGASVTTAGYGDLFNGGLQSTYTAQFSGTSSATPIVAGAAAQLAGIHVQVTGLTIPPKQLRQLMASTGTPTSSGPAIGPRPDVRSAVEALGFPVVNISGNLVPGGTYTATSNGVPGDGCVMVFGTAIRDVNPVAAPPYGYFMLAGNLTRKQAGALDATGKLSYSETIPADPNLSGTTLGYYLTWQRFLSGQPGIGAFGNVAAIEIR
jgi:subtilisin family serine protease